MPKTICQDRFATKRSLDWDRPNTVTLFLLSAQSSCVTREEPLPLPTHATSKGLSQVERKENSVSSPPPSPPFLTCMHCHSSTLSFHVYTCVSYLDFLVQLMITKECLLDPILPTSYHRCAAEDSGVQAHCPLIRSYLHCSQWYWWLLPYRLLWGWHQGERTCGWWIFA